MKPSRWANREKSLSSKYLAATFLVQHKLDKQEIMDIAVAIEHILSKMGISNPDIIISVTPDASEA